MMTKMKRVENCKCSARAHTSNIELEAALPARATGRTDGSNEFHSLIGYSRSLGPAV
jgi:hypothetical protein